MYVEGIQSCGRKTFTPPSPASYTLSFTRILGHLRCRFSYSFLLLFLCRHPSVSFINFAIYLMSWNEQISFRQHAKGGRGLKGMQLCSSGENVRWKIDQSEAKLVPFAMFRSATRRNCRTFPCDFIQQICTIFISFSFPLFFLVIFVSFSYLVVLFSCQSVE